MEKREKLVTVSEDMRELKLTNDEIEPSRDRIILFHQEVAENLGKGVAQLLSQVEYLWKSMGCKPFYKYMEPCGSARYGDSMTEKLSISHTTLYRLLRKVGTKVRNKVKAAELARSGQDIRHLIIYRRDSTGKTYWYFNQNLYNKLRSEYKATLQSERMAYLASCKNGLPCKVKGSLYTKSNTKSNHRFKKEKEIYKEKEKNMNSQDYFHNSELKSKAQLEKETKSREKVKSKASTPTYRPPELIIEAQKRGQPMPLDFSVSPSIIAQAVEKYQDKDWVLEESLKFKEHYTNKNSSLKVIDWSKRFIDKWLVDAADYRKQNEGKYGTTESAGAERVRRLEELATTDIFRDRSFEELAKDLYQERYGNDEDSLNP
jgi:hypothetical protein